MQRILSPDYKFETWRKLWTVLAESQMQLGVDRITPQMIEEMRANQQNIDYVFCRAEEKRTRHKDR